MPEEHSGNTGERPHEPTGPGSNPAGAGGMKELRSLLLRFGVHPRRSRGQNFLHDPGLLQWIAAQAELGGEDVVLEIGGGSGFLTRELRKQAGHVVAAEIDERLIECLRWQFEDEPSVTVVAGDALRNKREVAPDLVNAVQMAIDAIPDARFQCVSNLPYAIGVSFVVALLRSTLPLARAIVMVQSEVADRITASPSTRDYGAASVVIQSMAAVRRLRSVPPTVFWPRPKIDSAILEVTPHAEPPWDIGDPAVFQEAVSHVFQHRRKRVANSLSYAPRFRGMRSAEVIRFVSDAGVDASLRGDQLDIESFARLARSMSRTNP